MRWLLVATPEGLSARVELLRGAALNGPAGIVDPSVNRETRAVDGLVSVGFRNYGWAAMGSKIGNQFVRKMTCSRKQGPLGNDRRLTQHIEPVPGNEPRVSPGMMCSATLFGGDLIVSGHATAYVKGSFF